MFHYPHDRSKKSRSRKISGEFRRDLRKFRDLLRENVPVPLIQVRSQLIFSGNPIVVESDASKYGWGAVIGSRWMHGERPESMQSLDIQILESLAVLFAAMRWKAVIKEAKCGVLFKIDNQPAMYSLRKGNSHQDCVRRILKVLAVYVSDLKVVWKTCYINTKVNVFADYLSRKDNDEFVEYAWYRFGRVFRRRKDRIKELVGDPELLKSLPEFAWQKIFASN